MPRSARAPGKAAVRAARPEVLSACPRTAATAPAAGFGAVAADLAILALLASQLGSAPGTVAPLPVAAAAAASLTRLTLARRAAGKCPVIRATLT